MCKLTVHVIHLITLRIKFYDSRVFYIEKRAVIAAMAIKSNDVRDVWFTGAIIFAVLIYAGTFYYPSSDIIAYKFLRVRHCAP